MTLLDLLFKIDKEKKFDNYNKPYEYWSIDTEGTFLFLTSKKEPNIFYDVTKVDPYYIEVFIPYIWKHARIEKPYFIPYEELETLTQFVIVIDSSVYYLGCQKYPLICVRGTCDKQCTKKELKSFCFSNLPCINNRPDWNIWTGKYPEFFEVLYDVVEFIKACHHMDTLIVMFDYTPNSIHRKLDFSHSLAFLIRDSNITIIGNSSKIKALYKEYNTKYPTQDRKIEDSISEPENNFYFKF